MPVKTVVQSETVKRFTIWDNFERHVAELKAIGASDADLVPLQAAAEKVAALETKAEIESGENPHLAGRDLGGLAAPYTCANGWLIAPPSPVARRYAMVAGLKLTSGVDPVDRLAVMAVIALTLWVLKNWGDGKRDLVMRVVYSSGALPEMMPALLDDFDPDQLDGLIADYEALMGASPAQKKTAEMQQYNAILLQIQARLSGTSTAAS